MDDHDRQGFLEPELGRVKDRVAIGVVGLSGGGSHIVQQLAHVGFSKPRVVDPKAMAPKHIHRLVGGTRRDALRRVPKCQIARRVFRSLVERPQVIAIQGPWQEHAEVLRECDIVVGCVDTFRGRAELEALCRRYVIPYIDMGMEVWKEPDGSARIAGQVILSMPGGPCMRCLNFLRDELLQREGSEYGEAGGRPQVVWVNGLLASAAMGHILQLVTGKLGLPGPCIYSVFDANVNSLSPHPLLEYLGREQCTHYGADHLGDPRPAPLG